MIKLPKILEIREWYTPATDYPQQEVGDYRIHQKRYTRGVYEMWGVDDHIFFRVTKPIPITCLQQRRGKRWHDWMVDDPPHWRAMEIYAEQSKGKVLTSGLGLGLIVHGLIKNPQVEQITVVEQSAAVVTLVTPNLPKSDKLRIIIGDFHLFTKVDQTEWDTIIVDLWVAHGADQKLDIFHHKILPTMVGLKLKYPKASLTFHGFPTVSDIQFASKETIETIINMKRG